MRPKAISVQPMKDYHLRIKFDNGETRIFDVNPLIHGSWMGELRDPSYFAMVRIGGLSVEWPNEQDICPDQLYECSVPEEQAAMPDGETISA